MKVSFFRIPISLFLFMSVCVLNAENVNFTTSHFSGSGNCASCHDGLIDTSGEDVSIVKDWGASMMANATKDPFWLAKVESELERNAHLSPVLNDKCTQCHAPMANYEITKVQGGTISLFGEGGVLDPSNPMHDAAMDGVSCTACHLITDDASLGTLEGFSGNYKFNNTKTIYGQYSDVLPQLMTNATGYTPEYGAHMSDSAMCATCHNLKTPYVDAEGNILTTSTDTEFPEQMPYTEWQHSIYENAGSNPQSCQDCHMQKTTAKVANRPRWLSPKAGFAKHDMVGPNTVMMTLLKDNASQLGVNSSDSDMDEGIVHARELLQSSMQLDIVSATVADGLLEARVKLLNQSGHKTPTSYPSRRMWLNFKVLDSENNTVFESGKINSDGSIVGADNDADQAVFEPHYDEITSADQVQIYEAIMGNSDDEITYTLLRAGQYLKDNRLTPQGFNKLNVPDDIAVIGLAANDDDFNLGSDEVVYRVPVTVSDDMKISVSLNYQPIAYGFLRDLYRDDELEQVQKFKAMYEAQSLKHELITHAEVTVVAEDTSVPPPVLVKPTMTFLASPSWIATGDSVTLSWSSTGADSCVATGGWSGTLPSSGVQSITLSSAAEFNLSCTGQGGSVSESISYSKRGRRWLEVD